MAHLRKRKFKKRKRSALSKKRRAGSKRTRSLSRKRFKRMRLMRPVSHTVSMRGTHVVRTYETERIDFPSSPGVAQDGYGFSFRCVYDAKVGVEASIVRGYDPAGTAAVNFAGFQGGYMQSDFLNLTRVFRYIRIKRMTMHVSKAPSFVYDINVGGANHVIDPGTDVILPWSAEPDLVNFSNGEFSNIIGSPDFYKRPKYKYIRPAGSKNGQVSHGSMTVIPKQPVMWPVNVIQGGTIAPNPQVRFKKTPAVDVFRFRSNLGNLNSAGWIWVWQHPGLQNQNNAIIHRNVWFTVQLEYYGVRPTGPTVNDPCFDNIDTGAGDSLSRISAHGDCSFGAWAGPAATGSCPPNYYSSFTGMGADHLYAGTHYRDSEVPFSHNNTYTGACAWPISGYD